MYAIRSYYEIDVAQAGLPVGPGQAVAQIDAGDFGECRGKPYRPAQGKRIGQAIEAREGGNGIRSNNDP